MSRPCNCAEGRTTTLSPRTIGDMAEIEGMTESQKKKAVMKRKCLRHHILSATFLPTRLRVDGL